jgi:uncharacterized protein with FMN-binding domain
MHTKFTKRVLAITCALGMGVTSVFSGTPLFTSYAADVVASATAWQESPAVVVPVSVPVPVVTHAADVAVHTVKSGDVLWRIARMHGLKLDELLALNPSIKNPNLIRVGQQVIVGKKLVHATEETKDQGSVAVAVKATPYENGVYRGVFVDGNEEQVGIEFTLVDGQVTKVQYRTLAYKGVDYRKSEDAKIKAYLGQYQALINTLVNKPVDSALEALYEPALLVDNVTVDVDVLTGASLRSGKVISAIRDGLNRGVYQKTVPSVTYDNGVYRGDFSVGGQQVVIEFELVDHIVEKISYRVLAYGGVDYKKTSETERINHIAKQFTDLIDYLKGKDIRTTLNDLHKPALIVPNYGEGVDAVTGATVRSAKVISAIQNALGRGVYTYKGQLEQTAKIYQAPYADGVYRGAYLDSGIQQVGVELTLKDQKIVKISYRALNYRDVDYRKENTDPKIIAWTKQYGELLTYLKDQDLMKVLDLYNPGAVVADQTVGVDVVSGATVRSTKVVSAIADALNRGRYSK